MTNTISVTEQNREQNSKNSHTFVYTLLGDNLRPIYKFRVSSIPFTLLYTGNDTPPPPPPPSRTFLNNFGTEKTIDLKLTNNEIKLSEMKFPEVLRRFFDQGS